MKALRTQSSFVGKFVLLTLVFFSFTSADFAQTSRSSIAEQAALVSEFEVNGLKVLVKRRAGGPSPLHFYPARKTGLVACKMRSKVGDVAPDVRHHPLFRLGVQRRLDFLQ